MVCVHTARSPERIWFMEYHWYEDYWDIPRRSPKGHVTGSGYYITGRLLKYKQPYIHTCLLYTSDRRSPHRTV